MKTNRSLGDPRQYVCAATEKCFDQQLFERFAHLDFSFVGRRQVNMPPLENTCTKTINALRARRDSCATPEDRA